MTASQSEGPLMYTLRELRDNTAGVMKAINSQNRPAFITHHGRPINVIQPLANIENLEGTLIEKAIEAGMIDLDTPGDRVYSSQEMADMIAQLGNQPGERDEISQGY